MNDPADRARKIVEQIAREAAAKAGTSFDFFWTRLGYKALVCQVLGSLPPEGLCKSCGDHFRDEFDIKLEYIAPPRSLRDWERLHAYNIVIFCTACT